MKKLLFKTVLSLCGGVSGLIEMALKWFNENVLAKCKDKEEMAAYCTDIEELANFLDGIFTRHQKWMSEARRDALKATIDSVKELATALKDANVTAEELDKIIDRVKAAIDKWMEAK